MLDQLNIYSERFSYRLSIGPRALTTSIDFYFNITFCVHIQSERAHTNNSQSILFHIEFVLDVEHSMNERYTERKINERTDKGWKRNRRVDRKLSERERERENLQKLLQISTRITALGNLLWPSPPLSFHSLEIGF